MPTGTEQPLLAFYGDDVTGSTDSLEAAALAGVPAILFLAPPTTEQLRRHPGVKVVGVAGDSRSRSPAWMDEHLPSVFERLKQLGAPLCHYKTCSTFDSSPTIGNIGRAIEIGLKAFGGPVPVVVGVLRHRRFVMFSNLFAAGSVGGMEEIYRVDRHPTMSRHPVTPMSEADLRLHLAKQTKLAISGFDVRQMQDVHAVENLAATASDVVVLDTFDAATTRRTGELLTQLATTRPLFVAGSSGVEYAVFDYLKAEGRLPLQPPPEPSGPVDRIVAIYGSCSPVSERQIAWAEANGMVVIAADTAALLDDSDNAESVAVTALGRALTNSTGVVLYTARGPNDPGIAQTRQVLERSGHGPNDSSQLLGERLGRVLSRVIKETGVRRVALAGGDSSSHAVSQLGIEALEVAGPLVPGAPLCRMHSKEVALDGAEIVLKGGQVGGPDFLGRLIAGR